MTAPSSSPVASAIPVARPQVLTRPFILLLITQVLFGLAFSLFFLLPKFMTRVLHASASEIGLAAGIAPAAGVLAIPFVASAVDRFGRRKLVVAGAAVIAATAVGFMWVDRVGPLLFVLRALQGCAFATAFNAAATLAADLAPKSRLSQALGWFGVAFLATNSAAPLIAEPLAEVAGWPLVFGVAAVMGCCASAFATRLPEGSQEAARAAASSSSWGVLLQPRVLAMYFGSLVAGVGLGTAFTFHQPFALQRGAERVGGFFLGYTAAAVFVRIFLGSLPDRLGRLRVGRVAILGYAVVVACMSQLTPSWLVPFGLAFGFVHGMMYPSLNAVAVESASDAERGKVMSFYNGSFNLGVAGASFGLGHVAESRGYPTVFLITAAVVVLALPVLLLTREPRPT